MAKTGSTPAILAWAGFEGARNPYTILITIYVFMPYFAAHVAGGGAQGQATVASATSYAGLIVALTAPLLGFATDRYGPRKPLLSAVVSLLVPSIALLWFASPTGGLGVAGVVLLTVAAIVLFSWSETLHNALLLPAAGLARAAGASGLGFAAGNAMSVLMLLGVLWAFALPGQVPWSFVPAHPLWGLDPATFEPARIAGPVTAAVLACGLPALLLIVPDVPRTGLPIGAAIRAGAGDLKRSWRLIRAEPDAARFLLARMIYADGKTAVLTFGGVYAAGIMHWGTMPMIAYGIVLSVLAVVGGLLAPSLDNRFGARNAIAIEIATTILVLVGITGCSTDHILYVPHAAVALWPSPVFASLNEMVYLALAGVSAVSITAAYASSRTFMARLVPPERAAAFFGIYALSGTATMWLGSVLVGVFTVATHSQLGGYAAINLLLLTGLVLLFRVRARG